MIGLQYHLEITPSSVDALIDNCRHELVRAPTIQTEGELRTQSRQYDRVNIEMNRLLGYFLSLHRDFGEWE